ncbi:MAG: DUF2097 domain-containing protein [Methanobacterium sp.]|jgi:hypothetical protein|uniref:DUF2097 domain-containing protein n=1 Tax=Methanobacterium sp. TaxID=2164 RepID=UPI003C77D098
MEKEINLNADAAIEYVESNVKNYDLLEISFNRVFVPGEVLDISPFENDGVKGVRVLIKMNGKTIRETVELDLMEIKDDIIEIRHITEETSTVLVIEED